MCRKCVEKENDMYVQDSFLFDLIEQFATKYPDEYVTKNKLLIALGDYKINTFSFSKTKGTIDRMLKLLNLESASLVMIPLYHSGKLQKWLDDTKYKTILKDDKKRDELIHSDYLVDLDTSLKSSYKGDFGKANINCMEKLPDLVTYHSLYLKIIVNKDKFIYQ